MLEEPIEEKHMKQKYEEVLRDNNELRRENARLIVLCSSRFDLVHQMESRIANLKTEINKLRSYLDERKKDDR